MWPDHPRRQITDTLALSREELDFQLSPSKSAKDAEGVLHQLALRTAAAKRVLSGSATFDLSYGIRSRQKLDLFRPAVADGLLPCVVFLHGGFWQLGDKSVSGFAAEHFVAMGWSYVAVGYTLTPDISLAELVEEISQAVSYIQINGVGLGIDPARVVVIGHSAGGHLAAALVSGLGRRGLSSPLAGAVLISGVFDLEPIAKSYVAELTPMGPDDVVRLSPARFTPRVDVPVHLLVGEDEPEAFLVQSDVLHARWQPALSHITAHLAPGRDHFDVLFDLMEPQMTTVLRSML